jgi:hypothetical protein
LIRAQLLKILFFPLSAALLILAALNADGVYDPGDGVMHYLFARYAPDHPELFLDHWGKPVYITFFALPAQLGYNAVVIINILVATTGAWLLWSCAASLKLRFAWLVAPLYLFAPIVTPVAMSGLTETLFAFVLIAGLYGAMHGRHVLSAIVLSLLPYVRTEGILVLPFFMVWWLWRRDFRALLLSLSGTAVLTVVGGIIKDNWLWLWNENPYQGEPLYGHGTWHHYLGMNEFIWGIPLTVLVIAGIISAFRNREFFLQSPYREIWLVYAPAFCFLVAHSVFWWQGLYSSLGLPRVFAAIMPLFALIGLRGLNAGILLLKNPVRQVQLVGLVLVLHLGLMAKQKKWLLHPDNEQRVLQVSANVVNNFATPKNKVFCSYPVVAYYLDRDIFDAWQWAYVRMVHHPEWRRSGDVMLWETHFGHYEIGMDTLQLDTTSYLERVYSGGDLKFRNIIYRVK